MGYVLGKQFPVLELAFHDNDILMRRSRNKETKVDSSLRSE
jgi:hypothetical protein